MTNYIRRNHWAIFAGIMVVAALMVTISVAHANPFQFLPTTQFATATTSVQYLLSNGSATTTTFDSYNNGQIKAVDKGVLLTQFAASSTSSSLNIAVQYSQDGIDWYADNLLNATTSLTNIQTANTFQWLASGTATSSKATPIAFPLRYMRVIYTLTGANGAIWWQIVPQRQSN